MIQNDEIYKSNDNHNNIYAYWMVFISFGLLIFFFDTFGIRSQRKTKKKG